jgi:hypothetical protein
MSRSYGWTLSVVDGKILLQIPFIWSVPNALMTAELACMMPGKDCVNICSYVADLLVGVYVCVCLHVCMCSCIHVL